MGRALGAAVAAAALFAPPSGALAQSEGEVQLSAVSFLPIDPGTPIRVRLLDDSDRNLDIKKQFENALSVNGYILDADATVVLTFDTREDEGAYIANKNRYVVELKAEGGREGGEEASAIVNVFNSESGGLLNKGDRPGTNITAQSVFRMDATVDDKTNGRRLWEGWTVAPLSHNGPDRLIDAMVPALAAHVGKSANQVPIPVR
jgi:hypothetical protein